jgi:hypothetical protein
MIAFEELARNILLGGDEADPARRAVGPGQVDQRLQRIATSLREHGLFRAGQWALR